jgi:hypothetical protein
MIIKTTDSTYINANNFIKLECSYHIEGDEEKEVFEFTIEWPDGEAYAINYITELSNLTKVQKSVLNKNINTALTFCFSCADRVFDLYGLIKEEEDIRSGT